jgi:hypothetical protein
MRKSVAKFCAMLLLSAVTLFATAADNDWLVGKWELTYDSDNGLKDWLEFTADGKTYGITPDGRRIPGRYAIKGSQIEIVYSYDGKMVPLTLRFTDDKEKLLAYSARTKNTSQYKKVEKLESETVK